MQAQVLQVQVQQHVLFHKGNSDKTTLVACQNRLQSCMEHNLF